MEKIEKAIRNTAKKCPCDGNIIETFTKTYGKGNGVIGPGYKRPSHIESLGFGCDKCGQQYGEPVFVKTKPTKQIEFELSLNQGVLTKKITVKDLPFEITAKKGRKVSFEIFTGNKQEMPFHEIIQKRVVPKTVPARLKGLRVGSKVFVLPSNSHKIRNGFLMIQLSKKEGSKTFKIKSSCVK